MTKDEEKIHSLKEKLYSFEAVLTMLVELKEHKDKHGKDEKYLIHQPIAWENAFRLLKRKKLLN